MKWKLYLVPLALILLLLNGCVSSGHLKCPDFISKKPAHNTGYLASLHRNEKKNHSKKAAETTDASTGINGVAGIGGARPKQMEIKLPPMFMASINDDEIQGLNEMFKIESKSTVSIERYTNKQIILKARSRKDFNHMVMNMANYRRHPVPDGGGGGGSLGLAAGIIGIIAFVLAFGPYVGLLAFPLAIVAIILGILGLGSSRPGWAIAGIIFGVLAILVAILFLLLFFASFL